MSLTISVPLAVQDAGYQYFVRVHDSPQHTLEIKTPSHYSSCRLAAALIEHAVGISFITERKK